jgi:exonuclease III
MATLLRDPRVKEYDILAIQEPWRNPFQDTTHHPAKDSFYLCYPESTDGLPSRVCFFVNKRLDNSKCHFKEYSRDLCSIVLNTGETDAERIVVSNVYNQPQRTDDRTSAIPLLEQLLDTAADKEHIVVGDFNLHHEIWGGGSIRQRPEAETEELIRIMDTHGLTSLLEPGTITYEESTYASIIDLTLATTNLVDRLVRCEVEDKLNHDSDHLPIATCLDGRNTHSTRPSKRNWKAMDKKAFISSLEKQLPPQRRPRTKASLDKHVGEIVAALTNAIQASVPISTPSTKARAGWDRECSKLLADTK